MNRVLIIFIISILACQSPEVPNEKKVEKPRIDYYGEGKEMTALAQTEFMKNVKAAMDEGGPVHAINFCNIHATPLIDSISKSLNCQISRISLKNRNPENHPTSTQEKILMNNYLERYLEGSSIRDTLVADQGKLIYYRPIVIAMEACLKCHGQVGSDISSETMTALNELYPEDKATNYRMGDFRGAWRVEFDLETIE